MEREALVAELRSLRERVARLTEEAGSPGVEWSLRRADMYLHFALWPAGEGTS